MNPGRRNFFGGCGQTLRLAPGTLAVDAPKGLAVVISVARALLLRMGRARLVPRFAAARVRLQPATGCERGDRARNEEPLHKQNLVAAQPPRP